MKIAVIPWGEIDLEDKLFYTSDKEGNVVPRKSPMYDMQQVFLKNGDEFHTVDIFPDLSKVDFFLMFELNWEWLHKLIRIGKEKSVIYCNAEPPVVTKLNCPKGYRFLAHFFPYILTWNREWIDDKTVFRRNIPYYFSVDMGEIKFDNRKLITGISGNKKSRHPSELYSEREKVYSFLEKNYPNEFEFFGTGWDKKEHPNYCGKVESKSKTYHKYRYAICFENMKDISDYVTEKIWDCLGSGIVPIYAGAKNIEDYVPRTCYIDYFQFSNCEELVRYLLTIDEEQYQGYLFAAQKLLESNIKEKFSGEEYARCIYNVVEHDKKFKISWICKCYIVFECVKKEFFVKAKRLIKTFMRKR